MCCLMKTFTFHKLFLQCRTATFTEAKDLNTSSNTVHMHVYKSETVCKTNFSGLNVATARQHPSIRYGHVAACIFRTTSTTWAPSGHQHASVPCLSPSSILLQKVADLLRVGYSWIELSKLATFLVRLKGKVGHALRQQLGPKRDATMFVAEKWFITVCYHIEKIFSIFFLITIWNNLAVKGTNYFT